MDCSPPGSSIHGDSPGKNTGVGCHALLQGISSTQGWNPGLPHSRQILYQLSHQRSPRIQEWVAYPFSRGTFQPRNRTGVSCIAGRFLTSWATQEAQIYVYFTPKKKKREREGGRADGWMNGWMDLQNLTQYGGLNHASWFFMLSLHKNYTSMPFPL